MKIGITKCLKINSYSNYSDHNIHDNRKHNTQYWHTFKRGFLKNSNALQKSYRDTWHSIIRASAICISSMVKAKVGSTGVAGHKPCNSRLSATVWHAQQMRDISWWRPKWKENRIEMFRNILRLNKTSLVQRRTFGVTSVVCAIVVVWNDCKYMDPCPSLTGNKELIQGVTVQMTSILTRESRNTPSPLMLWIPE